MVRPDFTKKELEECLRAEGRDPYLKTLDLRPVNLARCSLVRVTLSELVLDRVILSQADLSGATLINTSMVGSDLRGAVLKDILGDGVDLTGANLSPLRDDAIVARTDMTGARIRDSKLNGANLERVILNDADLTGSDLSDTRLQEADLLNVNLKDTRLTNAVMTKESLGKAIKQEQDKEYRDARYVYLKLKDNFQSIGAYDDAAWAYIREREMERKSYYPWLARGFYASDYGRTRTGISRLVFPLSFYVRYTLKLVYATFLGAIWGYGQRPANVLIVSIITVAIFAIA